MLLLQSLDDSNEDDNDDDDSADDDDNDKPNSETNQSWYCVSLYQEQQQQNQHQHRPMNNTFRVRCLFKVFNFHTNLINNCYRVFHTAYKYPRLYVIILYL